MPYREDVPRVSIAQARARFLPRAFRVMRAVILTADGVAAQVRLLETPGAGAVRGLRRWFVCPRCERPVNVLGMTAPGVWVCARCGGWRSRNRVSTTALTALADGPGQRAAEGAG